MEKVISGPEPGGAGRGGNTLCGTKESVERTLHTLYK